MITLINNYKFKNVLLLIEYINIKNIKINEDVLKTIYKILYDNVKYPILYRNRYVGKIKNPLLKMKNGKLKLYGDVYLLKNEMKILNLAINDIKNVIILPLVKKNLIEVLSHSPIIYYKFINYINIISLNNSINYILNDELNNNLSNRR